MTDPIADMLTRIRNAQASGKAEVVLPYSEVKYKISELLAQENYLAKVEKAADQLSHRTHLRLVLKYRSNGKPVIKHIRRVSRPSKKVYQPHDQLPKVLDGYGLAVISTSRGVMTDAQARKEKLGGEVMLEVW